MDILLEDGKATISDYEGKMVTKGIREGGLYRLLCKFINERTFITYMSSKI